MPQVGAQSVSHALLLVGHGSRDPDGQREFMEFAAKVQQAAGARPVVPCFLELAEPTIPQGVARCMELGYRDIAAVPVLLFAARHNKHDVPGEFDHVRQHHPDLRIRYARHFGITTEIVDGLHTLITHAERQSTRPRIGRERTVVLVVGRGSSDPDANSDVCKLARILWEGSGLLSVETCFIGITHPRLPEGLQRCLLLQPERIIVLPYLLFTGVLVKRIAAMACDFGRAHPEVEVLLTDDIGELPVFMELLFEREREAVAGIVHMNCDACKWRRAGLGQAGGHEHGHTPEHGHSHSHDAAHEHPLTHDPYADFQSYHDRIWKPL
ncbi:MAG TPA: sirohydrochlorin chelatase [Candidatus Tectomicrobia bacterium]|nr:sirohydrochlorin chelatase [Candidatus Tectomicrobia bacterium]